MEPTPQPTQTETNRPASAKERSISWKALETNTRAKSNDWYFLLWTIALAGAAIATMLDNILFGILLVVAAFIITIYAAQKPNVIQFTVFRKGIRAGNLFLPFTSLSMFAVAEDQEPTYLLLQSKKTLSPLFSFPVSEEVNIEELKEYLSLFLEEGELDVPVYQQIMDRMGF